MSTDPDQPGAAPMVPRILFVCLGNICRSPTAHGVFRSMAQNSGLKVTVDSAGTGGWHIGNPPDPRTIKAAASRGYDLTDLRARQFVVADFAHFDLILAMDRANLRDINAMRPANARAVTRLFLAGLAGNQDEVPDPYYGGGFGHVLDLIEAGSTELIAEMKNKAGP